MIEAVENHMPEVIVIDEIGTEAEATAARTIAERGVELIATAHGRTLENLASKSDPYGPCWRRYRPLPSRTKRLEGAELKRPYSNAKRLQLST